MQSNDALRETVAKLWETATENVLPTGWRTSQRTLEIAEVRANADMSHDSDPERPKKMALREHSIYTHFPKDQIFEVCKHTKITWPPCRRRTGNSVLRAEKFGDLITTDHKVLNEGIELMHYHRYSIVVQDSATTWIQSYPCKTKTSQETERSLRKFFEPSKKAQSNLHWQFIGIWQVLWRLIMEITSLYFHTPIDPRRMTELEEWSAE